MKKREQTNWTEPMFIAGPCVMESEMLCLTVARTLKEIGVRQKVNMIFKASFDKANRSSVKSFRGPGLKAGLSVLKKVKDMTGLPVLTDIHEPAQAKAAAAVVDILQIPAFLCRQTDLLLAAADTGKWVNVKKGQFLAPEDMIHIIDKLRSRGHHRILVTERGTSFRYHNLVVDMRSLVTLRAFGVPVIFDATHSVQQPGGGQGITLGDRRMVAPLARAAAAVGVDGFFMEVHPEPNKAKSDAANTLALSALEPLIIRLLQIQRAAESGCCGMLSVHSGKAPGKSAQ